MDSNKIYLTQTDTTIGFLSKDYKKLNKIKKRNLNKKILIEVDSLSTLKNFVRIPRKFKKKVRRTVKTTFIYPKGESFRVVKDNKHLEFLKKFKWMYSTSANLSGKKFDKSWAVKKADVIVENKESFFENKPSTIYKINNHKIKKIR